MEEFPKYPTIGKSFENIGKDFKSSVPSIKVPTPSDNPNRKPMFTPKQQDFLDKLKKWGLIIAVLVVINYAVYRILLNLFA